MSGKSSLDQALEALAKRSFAIRDDLLPEPIFRELDAQVLASWLSGIGWKTRIKGVGAPKILPLQANLQTQKLGALIDSVEARDAQAFTYIYHQLHCSNDRSALVQRIEVAAIAAWREVVDRSAGIYAGTNFSLTAFTPGCRLAPHTDHGGRDAYRLTILLYFTGEGSTHEPLCFGDRGHPARIYPRPNRSVVFAPSKATNHWIEPVPSSEGSSARLAFSGWIT